MNYINTSIMHTYLTKSMSMKYIFITFLLLFTSQVSAEEDLPTIAPYELLKNPFLFKNEKVILNPLLIYTVIVDEKKEGGFRVVEKFIDKSSSGKIGLKFNRIFAEKQAIYKVMRDNNYPPSIGEMIVYLPKNPDIRGNKVPLSYEPWIVEPLGQIEVYNSFGVISTVPAIKFLAYVSETDTSNNIESADSETIYDKPKTKDSYNCTVEDELLTFAKSYINSYNSSDIDALLEFYSNSVEVNGKKLNLQSLRNNIKDYFIKWPNVLFNIDNAIEIGKKEQNIAALTIPVRFILENPKQKELSYGTYKIKLGIAKINNKWKVVLLSDTDIEQKSFSIE